MSKMKKTSYDIFFNGEFCKTVYRYSEILKLKKSEDAKFYTYILKKEYYPRAC